MTRREFFEGLGRAAVLLVVSAMTIAAVSYGPAALAKVSDRAGAVADKHHVHAPD